MKIIKEIFGSGKEPHSCVHYFNAVVFLAEQHREIELSILLAVVGHLVGVLALLLEDDLADLGVDGHFDGLFGPEAPVTDLRVDGGVVLAISIAGVGDHVAAVGRVGAEGVGGLGYFAHEGRPHAHHRRQTVDPDRNGPSPVDLAALFFNRGLDGGQSIGVALLELRLDLVRHDDVLMASFWTEDIPYAPVLLDLEYEHDPLHGAAGLDLLLEFLECRRELLDLAADIELAVAVAVFVGLLVYEIVFPDEVVQVSDSFPLLSLQLLHKPVPAEQVVLVVGVVVEGQLPQHLALPVHARRLDLLLNACECGVDLRQQVQDGLVTAEVLIDFVGQHAQGPDFVGVLLVLAVGADEPVFVAAFGQADQVEGLLVPGAVQGLT